MHRVLFTVLLTVLAFPAAAAAEAACVIVPNSGIDPADAETAAQIVCSHLRRSGEPVGDPVYEASGDRWRVSLRPLGRKIFLGLQEVRADGTVGREGEVTLQEIEEVTVGAPRLVESVLTGKSMAQTATVDTLVGEETRRYQKRAGETFFGLGFTGLFVPGTDVAPGAGFVFRWSYETVDFGVLGDLRFSGGSPADDSAGFFSGGVGGRWFLTPKNWSPFLGVGMGFTTLAVHELGDFDGSSSGLGGWVEAGVETLRFHDARLSFDVRAELPFFELEEEGTRDRAYYVPLSIALTYSF